MTFRLPTSTAVQVVLACGVLLLSNIAVQLVLFARQESSAGWDARHATDIRLARGLVGATEQDVRAKYDPLWVMTPEAQRQGTVKYPVPGYEPPPYPLEGRVLVTIRRDAVYYFYVGPKGRIERVFWGRS